jgi:hypothetical protein
MLKILSKGHRSVPIFCCAICGSWIDQLELGAAVFQSPEHEGHTVEVILAHKGACHDKAEASLSAAGKSVGWQELERYLMDACHNGGLTVQKMIKQDERDQEIGRL